MKSLAEPLITEVPMKAAVLASATVELWIPSVEACFSVG
jgi:hypothetical protein